ncbi:MAG: MBL fold metallo-hydrolase [Vicinamibacteria bacterium]|jgi:L-ascorbate metabolism protein UlaG (beta-lactamase superfamily)|nr:MBL fold metallo-hydrolase [Vicinamibacteria bacterium]
MSSAAFAAPRELRFTFVGNMAFHVTDGERVLLSDFPYESGYSRYMAWDWSGVPPATEPVIVVTHRHRDHLAVEHLDRFPGATLIAPDDALALAVGKPVKPLPATPKAAAGGIEAECVTTPHASVGHCSWLVTWHGLRMWFTGDTEGPAALLAARDLDVAFVSPWVLARVARLGARIDARKVVVYHQQPDEVAPPVQDSVQFKQGESFTLAARER